MYRLLVIEDDMVIAKTLCSHFETWDLRADYVTDFKSVLELFIESKPDMVLLDITLPYYNGFYWCREIRKISNVPIIFISSAAENMNIVMAMDMGGDEFIEKPFDLNVITAKVQALLRRSYSFAGQTNVLEHKGVILNLNDTSLLCGDTKVDLTKNEFYIMQMLMERAGKIVPREELMERLWGNDEFVDDNTLTVNITRLRRKLEEQGITDYVKTRKGIGYIIES